MAKWQDDAKADPEIGGEQWNDTEKYVALVMEKLSPPNSKDANGVDLGTNPLKEILKITGLGHHVELNRIFRKMGKILDDDKIDIGGALGDSPKSRAEIMFPTQP